MPRASVKENLKCEGCGARIITDSRLTCPRCHESVQIASSKACPEQSRRDVVRDEQGRWKCQKCLEHGKPSKTLAVGDEIQCRVCPEKTKNNLFVEKEQEMTKTTAVKTESGTTKLTTKEYNVLLQQWLKEEKKNKRNLKGSFRENAMQVDRISRLIELADRRIEALEKAIALNFDPEELERKLNIPVLAHVSSSDRYLGLRGVHFEFSIHRYINVGWIGGSQVLPIEIRIYPLERIVSVGFFEKIFGQHIFRLDIRMNDIESISCFSGFGPMLEFSKNGRRLRITLDGQIDDSHPL